MIEIIISLFIGIILGLLLAILSLWIFQIKCPQCKQLKPLKEITIWHWKTRKITGQPCQKCQKRSELEIEL